MPNKTMYFRGAFTAGAQVQEVRLSIRVDDGAIVYLNGNQVASINMPAAPVTYNTPASGVDPYDGQRWLSYKISPSQMLVGNNVLAVEVHQSFTSTWISGDASFDVTLAYSQLSNGYAGLTLKTTEEFSGTALNPSIWRTYDNSYGTDAATYHCNKPENVTVANGIVNITPVKKTVTCSNGAVTEYTTGFFASREAGVYYPLFGRYEARLKIAHGQGLWPGFWLRHRLGASTAEVDLMESFYATNPGTILQTLHFPKTIGSNVAKTNVPFETPTQGLGGWHIYTVDIKQVTPGDLTKMLFIFYVDGFETLRYTHTNASTITAGDLSQGWDIAFSYYIGGEYIGHPDKQLGYLPKLNGGSCAQTLLPPADGNPASCPTTGTWLAPWPSTQFQIDYVRVYQPT